MRTLISSCVLLLAVLPAPAASEPELVIRIIYDNTSAKAGIEADWGFAALVTFRGQNLLFDSGTRPPLFLENLEKMNIDPASISNAVISHQHGDHRNGIYALYPKNPSMKVHFLDSFPGPAYQQAADIGLEPVRVTGPAEILPGIYTTGEIAGRPPEQALVVETSEGLVIVTGCSHPGVVKLVEAAKQQRKTDAVRLVVGGFHMLRQNEARIGEQIARLKELNVARAIPAHCTGEAAIALFRREYGSRFDTGGAGRTIRLD